MQSRAVDDAARAREALHSLDPGCPRDEWVRIAMAAKAAGIEAGEFVHWSSGGANFKGEKDCLAVWRSINQSGGVTAATLFAMARDAGNVVRPVNGHAQIRMQPRATPLIDHLGIWKAAEAADADHPYIRRKLGLVEGLRVYRGPLRIAGQAIDGALLVPAFDLQGELQTWQAILPAGPKLNCAGRPVAGWFKVGGPITDQVYLVEGVGQAWAAHQATRKPALCCFGWGNVQKVAKAVLDAFPGASVAIIPDVGKEDDAREVASKTGARVITLPADLGKNGDINDLHRRDGLQAVAELLAGQAEAADDFHWASLADLNRNPPPAREWVIEGWIPRGTVTTMFGAGGVGKSLLVQQLATCVNNGVRALNANVTPGPVIALLAEDDNDEVRRRQGWILKMLGRSPEASCDGLYIEGRAGCDNALMLSTPAGLVQTALLEKIRQACRRLAPVLLILDNIAQLFGGKENDRFEVTSFLNVLSGLAREFNVAVLLLGHVAKAIDSEYSGSTAWEAAVRTRLFLEGKSDGVVELARKKANYASKESVTLEFVGGAFQLIDESSGEAASQSAGLAIETIRAALKTFTAREIATSHQPTTRTFLVRLASREGLLGTVKESQAIKALNLMIDRGELLVNEELGWRNKDRHVAVGVAFNPKWGQIE